MAKSHYRGHIIICENGKHWRLEDTGQLIVENPERPCAKCGRPPTHEGYDACIGHVEGAVSACCGHGVTTQILVMK